MRLIICIFSLLAISRAFALDEYCPNIDFVNQPIGSPISICVEWVSGSSTLHCEVKCGGGVCVALGENPTTQGPYVMTGKPCGPAGDDGDGDTGGGDDTGGDTGGTGSDDGVSPPVSGPRAYCVADKCYFTANNYVAYSGKENGGLSQVYDAVAGLGVVQTHAFNMNSINQSSLLHSLNSLSNNFDKFSTDSHNLVLQANDYLSNIKWRLDNIGHSSDSHSGSSSSNIDYTPKFIQIIQNLDDIHFYTNQMNTLLNSMRWDDTNNLNGIKGSMYNIQDYLSQITSALQSSGSGGSDGSDNSLPASAAVGTANNPGHLASASYKHCADCIVDVEGAKNKLESKQGELKALVDDVTEEFTSLFAFENIDGVSAEPSCFDFGDFVGQKCIDLKQVWQVLKSIVWLIFIITAFYMLTRDNKGG